MLTVNLQYEIEKTKDGYDILKLSRNEKSTYIGSKYNMEREINKFLEKFNNEVNENSIFFIYGFGIGDHIKALREKYNNKIIVFEPNSNLYEYIDELEWLKDEKNIEVICCEKDNLIRMVSGYINEFNFKSFEIVSLANYKQIFLEESTEFFKEINEFIVGLALEVNTKLHFGKVWFENLIGSIPYIVQGTPADLYENKYKNKPAVIVSAGPSLEKNVDLLKDIDDMLIISGGRTLPTLIDKKINPHLLVIADTGERNYMLVKDYIDEIDTPLLFFEGSNLNIVKHHKGKKIFFSFNELIFNIADRKIKPIMTGGSVAHVMTSYAAMLGCNPIIFIGQDLAYTDDRIHSKLTENRDGSCKYNEMIKNDDIFIKDVNGNTIRTSIVLNNYRIKLEKIISLNPSITFINATEGGASIKGTLEMKLKEALEKYKGSIIKDFYYMQNDEMKGNAIKQLTISKEVAENIINIISIKLEYLRINGQKETEEIIEEIYKNKIFEQLVYPVIYKFLTQKNNVNLEEQIERFYLEVIDTFKYAIEVIQNEINKLKNEWSGNNV